VREKYDGTNSNTQERQTFEHSTKTPHILCRKATHPNATPTHNVNPILNTLPNNQQQKQLPRLHLPIHPPPSPDIDDQYSAYKTQRTTTQLGSNISSTDSRVDRADSGPTNVRKKVQTHLPRREITYLTKVSNAVLLRQYFPSAWKHASVVPILKPGKDPTLNSGCRPISTTDTVGRVFDDILLTRILREVKESGLLREDQFVF
jgi:hypothetical protein